MAYISCCSVFALSGTADEYNNGPQPFGMPQPSQEDMRSKSQGNLMREEEMNRRAGGPPGGRIPGQPDNRYQ